MKTIYLVRHAKSSWKNSEIEDFDRPLNTRGKRDISLMSDRFAKRDQCPERFISSPAKRAKKTAIALAKAFGLSKEAVILEPSLYQFSEISPHLELIWRQSDEVNEICIVAHNHSLNELANYLSGGAVSHLVTLSIVKLNFAVLRWTDIQESTGNLIYHDYPKKYI